MTNHILTRMFLPAVFFLSSLSLIASDAKSEAKADKRVKGIVSHADRRFVRQDFDGAMEVYELAFKQPMSSAYSASLHLKVARLYLTLLDYTAAAPHYEAAMAISSDLFNSVDVCNYLDALRFSGQRMKAISLARRYAYRDVFHKDQRYQNILHALNYEEGIYSVGSAEYVVTSLDFANTANSEFWIGVKDGEYFYASSNSRFHDPNKRFYHRSNYYSLTEGSDFSIKNSKGQRHLLDMVPISLQNGPVSFSHNMTRMVVTHVYYGKGEGIGMSEEGLNAFQTRLYHSDFNAKRKGWSSFKMAFPQQEGYSYSHPYLFNNDRSLLFSSDMPGGFGGYDIYVAHWNEQKAKWGEPVNLGPQVNTEGDEISPSVFKDALIFSSNGHVGFGGYDIYMISYEDGQVVEGSLVHYDYPVNTVSNDFSMLRIDEDKGYIISDRNKESKDNLYFIERSAGTGGGNNDLLYGMSENRAISNGAIQLVNVKSETSAPLKENLSVNNRLVENTLSLYFEFNSYQLDKDELAAIEDWKRTLDVSKIDTLIIKGYADEIGGEAYNMVLSSRRASEVGRWLESHGFKAKQIVLGMGQTKAKIDYAALLQKTGNESSDRELHFRSISPEKRNELNREARRVEIQAIIK